MKKQPLQITTQDFRNAVRLKHPSITILSEFSGIKKDVQAHCAACGHTWYQSAEGIREYRPKCLCVRPRKTLPLRMDTSAYAASLRKVRQDILIVGEYTGIKNSILVKSLICGHEFEASADRILSSPETHSNGCKECSRKDSNVKGSHDEFVTKLAEKFPHFEVKSQYEKRTKPIRILCTIHNHHFSIQPHAVLSQKYGCTLCAQDKTGYTRRTLSIEGRTFLIQGYEGHFIQELVGSGLIPTIKNGKDVPYFSYTGKSPNTLRKINRTYRPDFYIEENNQIIEVKSTYTASGNDFEFETLKAKRSAVIDAGYDFQLRIYHDSGSPYGIPCDWHTLSREEFIDRLIQP
jgi:hypothetical protein